MYVLLSLLHLTPKFSKYTFCTINGKACQVVHCLTLSHTVPQLVSFTETLVEKNSEHYSVTVVFGQAI